MKRFVWILVVLLAASPAWAAKKVTVQQLKDLLSQLQTQKKDDAAVAAELKQIELSEQLTRSTMNSLVNFVPGPYSTEQVYVLEAKSAILPSPATDLPSKPAPDASLLAKAQDYASKIYAQLPRLTATKTTARFQDHMEAIAASSGMNGSAKEMSGAGLTVTADKFVRYINSSETHVESQGGGEILPKTKDKTLWGANGMTTLQGQPPVLSTVLNEAQADGHIAFLRWENVNGKASAVYSYTVDKKKTHYNVQYCCFPNTEATGTARFSNSMQNGGGAASATGDMQTNTDWHPWKSKVPYHGEFFVDPDTGIVVRLVVEADFKTSDIVHQEDHRFDYGPVTVGGKTLVVPLRSIVSTEVVINGDNAVGGYKTRHTLLTSEYKDYAAQ